MNFSGEGGDVEGVLESLMGQLMSKEVLYEPLKELYQKVCPLLINLRLFTVSSSQNTWNQTGQSYLQKMKYDMINSMALWDR